MGIFTEHCDNCEHTDASPNMVLKRNLDRIKCPYCGTKHPKVHLSSVSLEKRDTYKIDCYTCENKFLLDVFEDGDITVKITPKV